MLVGWDQSRLSMVLAVLEAHGGLKLGGYDVYLNVAGGLKIDEPAADAAAAAALIERAVEQVIAAGRELTGDLGGSASTAQMGDAIARAIATV